MNHTTHRRDSVCYYPVDAPIAWSSNNINNSSNKIYYQLNIYFPLGNTTDLQIKYELAIQKQNKMVNDYLNNQNLYFDAGFDLFCPKETIIKGVSGIGADFINDDEISVCSETNDHELTDISDFTSEENKKTTTDEEYKDNETDLEDNISSIEITISSCSDIEDEEDDTLNSIDDDVDTD